MPIIGTNVVGATGIKPVKLKYQLYAELCENEEVFLCVFAITPKLNKNFVLEIDLLIGFKGKIDTCRRKYCCTA